MHWMKYKFIYFTLSGAFLLLSIFSLIKWKMRLGVDFTGGAVINYSFSKVTDSALISDTFKKVGIEDTSISSSDQKHFTIKTDALTVDTKNKIDEELKNVDSEIQELRYEVVGPAIGPELIQKTVYALLISASLILFWVAYQFKNLKYGLAATLATIHDSLVLLGSFSLLGHFLGVEIDFIFVTAVLTILSFSVHDTIVVFDRIREVKKKTYGDISEISDNDLREVKDSVVKEVVSSVEKVSKDLKSGKLKPKTLKEFNDWCNS